MRISVEIEYDITVVSEIIENGYSGIYHYNGEVVDEHFLTDGNSEEYLGNDEFLIKGGTYVINLVKRGEKKEYSVYSLVLTPSADIKKVLEIAIKATSTTPPS
jgi:hypothetical protein